MKGRETKKERRKGKERKVFALVSAAKYLASPLFVFLSTQNLHCKRHPDPQSHQLKQTSAEVSKTSVCRTKDAINVTASLNFSQGRVKLNVRVLQHLGISKSLYDAYVTRNSCRATKIVYSARVLTCLATFFKCLRHIHISIREAAVIRA